MWIEMWGDVQQKQSSESSSFCEQKEPKKLYDSRAWAEAPTLPQT
jgi:hypothetical protein